MCSLLLGIFVVVKAAGTHALAKTKYSINGFDLGALDNNSS